MLLAYTGKEMVMEIECEMHAERDSDSYQDCCPRRSVKPDMFEGLCYRD